MRAPTPEMFLGNAEAQFGRLFGACLSFAEQSRSDAEAGQLDLAFRVDEKAGRLDVLVDQAMLVRLAKYGDHADGKR